MNDDIRKEMFEQFKTELEKEGISSFEQIQLRNDVPNSNELAKEKSFLKIIGKTAKGIIGAVCKGTKVAYTVAAVFVVLMGIPGAINNFKLHFPKQYEVAINIPNELQNKYEDIRDAFISENPDKEGYVVYRNTWLNDKGVYIQDYQNYKDRDYFNPTNDFIPVSGVSGITGAQLSAFNPNV